MAEESKDRKVMIAVLLTSTLLTMLGIAGVLRGAYALRAGPLPEDLQELFPLDESDENSEAAIREQELRVQMLEGEASNPYRRPMAAANIVVSSLVLIGSFLLSWRRKPAKWWIRQAVTAKLIWIVAYTATLVSHLKVAFPTLQTTGPGESSLTELIASVVLGSVISAVLHVSAAWRASRGDIAALIEASNP